MANTRQFSAALALLTSCFLLASGLAAADPDLDQKMRNPDNWAAQAGDAANHRWSNLKQIDRDNVGQLQVAWTISTGVLRGHEGSPLVIGDTIYLHTPFPDNVFAVSLKDQTFKWKYEPKQDPDVVPVMCCDTVSRGLAYGDGKIFLQQADTTLLVEHSRPVHPPPSPTRDPGFVTNETRREIGIGYRLG
jgi:lanthanide-dependent methanol dehydrogenase